LVPSCAGVVPIYESEKTDPWRFVYYPGNVSGWDNLGISFYAFPTTYKSFRSDSLTWYCSELAWAAYYNQGVNIECSPDDLQVRPQEIFDTWRTTSIGGHRSGVPWIRQDYTLPPEPDIPDNTITFMVFSPVEISITDPDGLSVGLSRQDIPGAMHIVDDFDDDGDAEQVIYIPGKKDGEYTIKILPKPEAQLTDIYSVKVIESDQIITLAEDVQIDDIPGKYVIDSSDDGIKQVIQAMVDFDPDTFNLKSMGKTVTAYIEFPVGHGYDLNEVDISSILLNDAVTVLAKPTEIGGYDEDGISNLMVKFDRQAVKEILSAGENIEIIITGIINGIEFEGEDYIQVTE